MFAVGIHCGGINVCNVAPRNVVALGHLIEINGPSHERRSQSHSRSVALLQEATDPQLRWLGR